MDLEHALGSLPDLNLCGSQTWCTSSFCDLESMDLELSDSGCAAGSSWVGCDLLLDDGEEFSSKLLNQAFGGLVHAASTTITELELELSGLAAASPARSMPAKDCSPAASALDNFAVQLAAAATAASPACSAQQALSRAGSRAGSPEPQPDLNNEEAVRLAGLALHLAQGDVNHAMAHLLTWAAAQ